MEKLPIATLPESNSLATNSYARLHSLHRAWSPWYTSLRQAFPTYIAIHIGFVVISCVSVLYSGPLMPIYALPFNTLWNSWKRWDAFHFISIASQGYARTPTETAYFPLYPLLARMGAFFTHSVFSSGLLISNISGLVMLVVLYRLVEEDFGKERATRTILYLSIFPGAFFFSAMYSESLFLTLIISGFYNIRRGSWWIAGLCGFLACLTRSTGILFVLPFLYEYLQQHHFKLRAIRFNILAIGLIPAGIITFAIYCYLQFHNPLLFLQAQAHWGRFLRPPWYGIEGAILSLFNSKAIFSFLFLRNMLDLIPVFFVLTILVLSFLGPWRFSRLQWSYGIFAIAVFLFSVSFPMDHFTIPLAATTRYLLAIFPAFIIIAAIGKNRSFNLLYISISGALLFFFLTQFLTGYWVI
jgi:Gpi18-like mannosyltransferase